MKHLSARTAVLACLAFIPISLMAEPARLTIGGLPHAKPEDAGMSSKQLGRIAGVMQGYVDRGEIPGAITLVARRGKIVHLETHGVKDVASREPMSADSVFRMASMTKPIASVALMMLYEEGHFWLTDPISEFIPEFKNPKVAIPTDSAGGGVVGEGGFYTIPADREITFQHVLTHTAGLPTTYGGPTAELYRDEISPMRSSGATLAPVMKKLAGLPLNFEPGTAWQYGPATDVVGYLVEVISGKPLDEFLRERIFEPLGMKDTHFYAPKEMLSRRATVYSTEGGKLGRRDDLMSTEIPPRSKQYFSGAGGLNSTIEDYLRFCQMKLNGGHFNGARILSRKTVELMTTDHLPDDVMHYPIWHYLNLRGRGFGLGYRVVTNLGHSAQVGSLGSYGWGGAYGTYFFIDPQEKMIGIFMTQIRPYRHLKIRRQFQILATAAIVD